MLPAGPDYGAQSNVPARVNATNDDRENKEWIVRSLEEIAELQRSDSGIGFIVRMRLQCEEQPSFDDVRSESKNAKIYWTQWLFGTELYTVFHSIKLVARMGCNCSLQRRCVPK